MSGVCLTVVELGAGATSSTVEMGDETLARTTLGSLRAGSPVNLEPPLRMGDPLGGHWVQGHVDTTVEVREREDRAEHSVVAVSLPAAMAPFVVEKGSVALDGVSLTVTEVAPDRFRVWLIPHTLEVTTLGAVRRGDRVNFEADVLAKYVGRALEAFSDRVAPAGELGAGR